MLILIYTLVTIHLGCVLASLYMHRYVIHRQYYLDPKAEWVMKIMYWILFGVVSREFVVQHRKHHEFSDTPMDPHTPHFAFGLASVFSSEVPPVGSGVSCLTPSEMRSFSTSMLNTSASSSSPFLKFRIASSPVCVHERSDK